MAHSYPFVAGMMVFAFMPGISVSASEVTEPPTAPMSQDAIDPADSPFSTGAVVDDADLAAVTGMADLNVLEQTINARNIGTVTGNTINGNTTTGLISIDGSSFDNFNGLALMNANTGNNVSINASMNVNVAIPK